MKTLDSLTINIYRVFFLLFLLHPETIASFTAFIWRYESEADRRNCDRRAYTNHTGITAHLHSVNVNTIK